MPELSPLRLIDVDAAGGEVCGPDGCWPDVATESTAAAHAASQDVTAPDERAAVAGDADTA